MTGAPIRATVLLATLGLLGGCEAVTPSGDPTPDPTPADSPPSWSTDDAFPWDVDALPDCRPEPAETAAPTITELPPATDLPAVWFPDDDCDGYGRPGDSFVISTSPVWGHAPNDEDCDDGDRWVPIPERHCDGIDNDCDGVELCDVDAATSAELLVPPGDRPRAPALSPAGAAAPTALRRRSCARRARGS